MSPARMVAILEAGQVDVFRSVFNTLFPHLPQPANREQAEIQLHLTRTSDARLNLRARAYSHAWLLERALPSMLPDELKPKAQRIHPVKALAVGISVNFKKNGLLARVLPGAESEIRKAMEDVVHEAAADRRLDDHAFVAKRMTEAKEGALRALLG